jgi:hypothetical protein
MPRQSYPHWVDYPLIFREECKLQPVSSRAAKDAYGLGLLAKLQIKRILLAILDHTVVADAEHAVRC